MNSVVFIITVSLLFMLFLAANTSEEEKRRNTSSADQVNNWKLLPLSVALFIIRVDCHYERAGWLERSNRCIEIELLV